VTHSPADAAGIGTKVRAIPLAVGTTYLPDTGDRIAFFGNLFYAPNHEAAMWICQELAPRFASLGVGAEKILIAGRRPHPSLREAADGAGVELQADVADLNAVLTAAAVVLAPMTLGSGSQYKVLDAIGAGRACVISPVANSGLGLIDGRSALIRERAAEPFADAIYQLLTDRSWRAELTAEARAHIAPYMPKQVADTWRASVREVMETAPRPLR
jgi:glycosyltransferase involved in cell wall biosynthesis